MDALKKEALEHIEEHKEEFIALAKEIWENPELALEEQYASSLLAHTLEKYDFSVTRNVADMQTAFVATFGSGHPVIGMSVEYDCLPGLSQKADTPYPDPVKEGAPGHGCGHNLLGTAAVLAAISLKEVMEKNEIEGTIKVFGTPAEEICVGKPFMAKAGLFDDLDYVLDWHPSFENGADEDICNAFFNVRYHYKGRQAHGNSPWFGRSALDGAIWTSHAIEFLREHIKPAEASRANTINYTFNDAGPEIPNVVPDHASLWVVGRFTDSAEMSDVMKRVDACAKAGALASGTEVEKEFISASREKIPNAALTKVIEDNMKLLPPITYTEEEIAMVKEMQKFEGLEESGLPTGIIPTRKCGCGVTDMAEYSWKAPTANFRVVTVPAGGWHNWKVAACAGGSIGFKGMVQAAKILAVSNIEVIKTPAMLEQAAKEFEEQIKDKEYVTLIPDGTLPPQGIYKATMKEYK